MSTYVYGITRASQSPLVERLHGIGDPPRKIRLIRQGELAAIVSDAPETLEPKRRDLLAHQHVLDEAGTAGAVLPMRFGGLSTDDETVAGVLSDNAEHFSERLKALDGRAEYNVKAAHDQDGVLRRVLADDPELRHLSEANRAAGGGSHQQQVRLGEAIASAVRAREAVDADTVLQALGPAAEDVRSGPQSSGWLANYSFLLEHAESAHFLQAVEDLRLAQPHLDLRVNGPLPPYSFVEAGPPGTHE